AAGIAAFKFGSDLSESLSQVGTVFGEEANKVVAASENMNDAFAQAEFLAFAGNIGDIAQGLGIAKDEADDVALSVLSLGQDLSSFKNVPIEQAVNAITNALTGERDSLKGLGIVLKDTDVKQRALEMGLWDGVEALSSVAQAQATMSLITEKSANSIGDFARTADGAANKARILKANLLDQAAAMGTKLLPIGTKLLEWLDRMVRFFSDLPGPIQNVVLVLLGLAAAVGPVLLVAAKLVKAFQVVKAAMIALNITMSLNPFVLLVAAVIALVFIIYKNWDKIVAFLKATWEWIKESVAKVGKFFTEVWEKVSGDVSRVWNTVIDFFKEIPGRIMDALATLATTVRNFIVKYHPAAILARKALELWPAVRDWLKSLPGKIVSGLAGLSTTAAEFIAKYHPVAILLRKAKEFWPTVSTWFKGLPGKLLSAIGDLSNLLVSAGKSILDGLLRGLKDSWEEVSGWVGGIGSKIRNLKGPAEVDVRLLTANGQLIMDGLLSGLQRQWPKVQSFMSTRGSDIESSFGQPNVAIAGSSAIGNGASIGMGGMADVLREQNELLRRILAKTGFFIDGRDLTDAIGEPFVHEIRARTGL
ncbi:hypothetical protein LCGC14_2087000, partial [marine sediment metagenome]